MTSVWSLFLFVKFVNFLSLINIKTTLDPSTLLNKKKKRKGKEKDDDDDATRLNYQQEIGRK